MSERMTVRIAGEPFQSRALKYRAALQEASAEWHALKEALGALEVRVNGTFQFPGEPTSRRDEWVKAGNRKDGWWRARKGTALDQEVRAMPDLPPSREVFGDAICEDYHYTAGDGCSGAGAIGLMFYGPSIGWHNDTFVCLIPDPTQAVERIRKQYPDAVFTNGCDKWQLPPELVRMTPAEAKLFWAQAELENERADAA